MNHRASNIDINGQAVWLRLVCQDVVHLMKFILNAPDVQLLPLPLLWPTNSEQIAFDVVMWNILFGMWMREYFVAFIVFCLCLSLSLACLLLDMVHVVVAVVVVIVVVVFSLALRDNLFSTRMNYIGPNAVFEGITAQIYQSITRSVSI